MTGMPRSTRPARFAPQLRNWLAERWCRRRRRLGCCARESPSSSRTRSSMGYGTDVPDGIVIEAALAGDGRLRASVIDARGAMEGSSQGGAGPRTEGLRWAEALVTEAQVTHGAGGTTGSLMHVLSRPAEFVTRTHGQPLRPTPHRSTANSSRRSSSRAASSSVATSIFKHRIDVGSPDRRRKPLRHSVFDDRPERG